MPSPWPNRQVGACKCSRTYASKRARSPSEAKGWCVALRLQLGKHPPRVHHATQSWLVPASFVGGGCSSIMRLAPPGRIVIAPISASGDGFATRATRSVASVGAVREETPVRLDPCVVVVPLTLGVPVLTAAGTGMGSKYASGMATQFVDCGKVPCLRSFIMDKKLGNTTPVTPIA